MSRPRTSKLMMLDIPDFSTHLTVAQYYEPQPPAEHPNRVMTNREALIGLRKLA